MAPPITRRLPVVGLLAAALGVLPFLRDSLGPSTAWVPAVLTAAVVCEALTAALLLIGYLTGGKGPLLGLACAYLFIALVSIAHALVLPGVINDAGIIAADPQVPAWLRAIGHAGLPIALAAALWGGPGPVRRGLAGPTAARGSAAVTAGVAVAAAAGGLTWALVTLGDALPRITVAGHATGLAIGAGCAVLAVDVVALVFVARRGRRSLLERRLVAVVGLTILATALTVGAGRRHTVAWYLADLLELAAAAGALSSLRVGSGRLKRWRGPGARARATDPLTGVLTREAALVAAEHLHCTRAPGTPLGLALVDLDSLAAIEAEHGPLAADAVLLAVAKRLQGQLRDDDVLGRSGDEGFLIVLPDTDVEGVTLAVDRAAAAIRDESVGTWAHDVHTTVSGGVAMVREYEDGLERAVAAAALALSQAKAHGSDQIVSPVRGQVVPLRRAGAAPPPA